MNPEGIIKLKLSWDGQRIWRVKIEPRPLAKLDALLRDKSRREVSEMIPMLFSVCRNAQGAAAASAFAAARGSADDGLAQSRERLVLCEALLEVLWRFLLDLPKIMGAAPNATLLAKLRGQLAVATSINQSEAAWQTFAADFERAVSAALFESIVVPWREPGDAASLMQKLAQVNTATARILLECWNGAARWGDSPIELMPEATAANVLAEIAPALEGDADFSRAPRWSGRVMETGALARMHRHPMLAELLKLEGHSIMARLLARLLEVGALFDRLRAPAAQPGWVQAACVRPGVGLAWVQTARGLLLHWVELGVQGEIENYRMVAPTEWNFHPDGACPLGLAGKSAAGEQEAQQCAGLMVHALDPCVAYKVEVEHA